MSVIETLMGIISGVAQGLLVLIWLLFRPSMIIVYVFIVAAVVVTELNHRKSTYYKITHTPYLLTRMNLGKYGEYLIYKKLRDREKDGSKFLFNVYLPKENGETTEIDVLMICRKGIFVFESKNYSGWIFGSEYQKNWTQTLPSRRRIQKNSFFNPIMQNKLHMKYLQLLVGEKVPLISVIAFSDRCTLKNIDITSDTVKVVNREEVVDVVAEALRTLPDALGDKELCDIYEMLYPLTQTDETVRQKHINDINEKYKTENENVSDIIAAVPTEQMLEADDKTFALSDMVCPNCAGKLMLRTAKRGENVGNNFYGCENYPKCRYIKPYTEEIRHDRDTNGDA